MTPPHYTTKEEFLQAVRDGVPSATYEQDDDGVVFHFTLAGDDVVRTCVALPDDEPEHIRTRMLGREYRVDREQFDEAHVDHLVHGLDDADGPLKDGLREIMAREQTRQPDLPDAPEPEPDRWVTTDGGNFLLYVEEESFYDDLGVLMFPLALTDQALRGTRDWAVLAEGLQGYLEACPDEMVWHRRMLCCLALRAGVEHDQNERYQDADRSFELARSADPNDMTVRTAMGASLTARGRLTEALEHFEAVIEAGRFEPEAWKPAIAIYETLATPEAKARAKRLAQEFRAQAARTS